MPESIRTTTRSIISWTILFTIVFSGLILLRSELPYWLGNLWILLPLLIITGIIIPLYAISYHVQKLSNQVAELASSTHEMAIRGTERRLDPNRIVVPELRDLAEAINIMAERAKGDIAEMKRLERVRSEFLGNVSHELRTPIFSVQGYLETLIDGAVDDPDVRMEFLNKAHHNALRLHTLLTDLIEVSRIESGEMRMSFRYFDIVEMCRSLIEELRPTAEMKDIALELHTKENGFTEASTLGDRDRIKQVMVNLVENAIKYNRPSGIVVIEIELRKADAVIRVIDSGIGIPEEDRNRIFERFYRVNKDRSRAVGGSGLGLAIVKHILEAHGSTIRVDSQLGEGTTFSFSLKRN